ncbi:MAG: response regulator transcription factor [Dinghuibacter sp.]|nr:response regulator transcription factor [Dinghuibacter sp.]
MIRAIIIDDEQFCIEVLEELLKEHCPLVQVIGTAQSGEDGLALLQQHEPDLIFLDIEMPRMSGFDFLEKLLPVHFDVIFTTAYDNYAIRAFKYSAMDYLLKPIDAADLKQAIEKYRSPHNKNNFPVQLSLLKENIRLDNPAQIRRLAIATLEGIIMQPVKDIYYCEASSSYTILHLAKNARIVSAKTLKEYEELLEHHGFFRVHHSHLVNLDYVEKYIKGDGGYLILSNGTQIPVSRSRKEALVYRLQNF